MKLIGSLTSPFVRKVRVALAERGLTCEFVVDSAWRPDDAISALNPLRKTPLLLLDDGQVVVDSRVIIEYLDALGTAPPLVPAAFSARIMARTVEALADGLAEAVVLQVQETWRPEARRSDVWLARQRSKVDQTLRWLDRHVTTHGLAANGALTVADVATGCALGVLDYWFPDHPWRPHCPALAGRASQLAARPSFASTAPPISAGVSFPAL